MKVRVGTLAVGTRFTTMLTGREAVVRAPGEFGVVVVFTDRPAASVEMHPDVLVRVEAVH